MKVFTVVFVALCFFGVLIYAERMAHSSSIEPGGLADHFTGSAKFIQRVEQWIAPPPAVVPMASPPPVVAVKSFAPAPVSLPVATPAPGPLPFNLILYRSANIAVQEGMVRLKRGQRCQLVADEGATVVVKVGTMQTVRLSRDFVGPPTTSMPSETVIPAVAAVAPIAPAQVNTLAKGLPDANLDPESKSITVAALAAQPETTYASAIGIEAHEIGTGVGRDDVWKTDYGSYIQDIYRTKGLEVNLSNVTRNNSGKCIAMVIWFGKDTHGKPFPHYITWQDMSVAPASGLRLRFWCPLMASAEYNYVALGQHYVTGTKHGGWLVVIQRDGVTVAGRGSNEAASAFINEPTELNRLVDSYHAPQGEATETMPHWRTDPIRNSWRPQSNR